MTAFARSFVSPGRGPKPLFFMPSGSSRVRLRYLGKSSCCVRSSTRPTVAMAALEYLMRFSGS